MSKVLFVTPDYHCGVLESAGSWLNCGFVYMAGELRKDGHQVIIYDAMTKGHNIEKIKEQIRSYSPDIVATSAYTSTMNAAAEVLKAAKEVIHGVVTLIGGVHPTFMYKEVLAGNSFIDFVVCGEGEQTLKELVAVITGGNKELLKKVKGVAYRKDKEIFHTGNRPFIDDLDSIEAAWDLVDWEDYTYNIYPNSRLAVTSTARGCVYGCSFCSQQKFWHQTWRARSVASVVGEIVELHTKYRVNVVMFSDELPTYDRQRWEAILDQLIDLNLDVKILMETRVDDIIRDEDIMWKYKKAGIVHIYVGVEAASQDTLDRFKKGILENDSKKALDIINSHGIVTETSFVLGVPEETKENILMTLELAKKYNPDFAHFLLLAPWPYADMYKELQLHLETFDYSEYNLVVPIIKPLSMTRDELFKEVLNCYQSFYFFKLPQWAKLADKSKKDYLLRSMRVILNNSFITQHIPKLGIMPEKVKRMLNSLNKNIKGGTRYSVK